MFKCILKCVKECLYYYMKQNQEMARLACIVIHSELLTIKEFINTFPKRQRINVAKHIGELAILGYDVNEITNKIKIRPLKYNTKDVEFDKQIKKLRKELLAENGMKNETNINR